MSHIVRRRADSPSPEAWRSGKINMRTSSVKLPIAFWQCLLPTLHNHLNLRIIFKRAQFNRQGAITGVTVALVVDGPAILLK